ncbi:MAG: hypothetical protein Q4F98_03785 [Lachnospiraceae bacterium]|nr:hypothetical protein [Lachnospiraceae bacterium]
MDGTIKTDSICKMDINGKTYKVTAYAHKDDKSITGVITDKVEIFIPKNVLKITNA